MRISANEPILLGKRVSFVKTGGKWWLMVELSDGRAIGAPLALYPTLVRASARQRSKWRRVGRGDGFQWPALDLDLSVSGIVQGRGEMSRRAPLRRSA